MSVPGGRIPIRQPYEQGVHDGFRYACDRCNFKTTTKTNLKSHNIGQHGEEGYECHLCKYRNRDQTNAYRLTLMCSVFSILLDKFSVSVSSVSDPDSLDPNADMDPDPASQVNPDPIRIQGFEGQKCKKKYTAEFFFFLLFLS